MPYWPDSVFAGDVCKDAETAWVRTMLSWWPSKPLKYCSFISSNCLSIFSNSLSLS